MSQFLRFLTCQCLVLVVLANPDAKRLYDDLLSNYNRLIRPVANNTDKITVRMGLKLSQLVDLVSDPESANSGISIKMNLVSLLLATRSLRRYLRYIKIIHNDLLAQGFVSKSKYLVFPPVKDYLKKKVVQEMKVKCSLIITCLFCCLRLILLRYSQLLYSFSRHWQNKTNA